MPRPRKLKLGLYTYPVKWVKECIPPDSDDEVSGYITHLPPRHISVCVDAKSPNEPAEVLLHEVVHGLVQDRALDRLFAEDSDEEMFVTSFSRGLLCALRENKGLAEYVVHGA